MSPDPRDFLGLDSQLTDEERAIRDNVRAFAAAELAPYVAGWYEDGTIPEPRALARRFGRLGLFGMPISGYGCAGTSHTAYGVACRELETVDSGLRSFVSVQGSLSMHAIHAYGSEEQKDQWLPALATGDALGCFGLTEPDSGSDPGSMRTRVRRDGADWILDGGKMWITNGTVADVAVVWARTDDGVRGFLVPTGERGFAAATVHHKASLRASLTAELTFDGVRLPATALLPGTNGLGSALSCLNEARFGIVWGTVGAARACYEAALDYATTREQFGRPLAGFQLTQRKLADLLLDATNAQLLAARLGQLKDGPGLHHSQVSLGKFANAAAALRCARTARSVLGANGITLEYPVIRHLANLETVVTYEGTEEIHALSIGQTITGISAFR